MGAGSLPTIMHNEQERFWRYVHKLGPDECWPWLGSKLKNGYGQFVRDSNRHITSSRMAWVLTHGELPHRSVFVCHKCDNPVCCNPGHMFTGTGKDNADDMDSKGRRNPPRGVRNCRAIIDEQIVLKIRSENLSSGESLTTIGMRYGLDVSHVGKIVRRKLWAHVD